MEKVGEGMKEYIIARAKEKSTWYGLTAFLTVFGIQLTQEQAEGIALFGIASAGLIAIFTKEKSNDCK